MVENFSPRVVEHFGLDYDSLVKVNPDVDHGAHAGIWVGGPVARLRGLGAQHRTAVGDVGLRPVTRMAHRAICKAPPIPIAGVHARRCAAGRA